MSVSGEIPQRCQECYKLVVSSIHKKCKFCQKFEFKEHVLCHLNRCIQKPSEFKCHAFQPLLKLADSSDAKDQEFNAHPQESLRTESIKKFLQSDKIKYQRALALQKLSDDPNGEFIDIKYHFAWNAIYRKPIFRKNTNIFDLIYDTFYRSGETIGELVKLLWLAPDHIHLYVETDGERSVEEIVTEVKRVSQEIMFKEYSTITEEFQLDNDIWDEAYFAETIG